MKFCKLFLFIFIRNYQMKTENLIYIKVMTGKFYMFQNVCIVKIIKITII